MELQGLFYCSGTIKTIVTIALLRSVSVAPGKLQKIGRTIHETKVTGTRSCTCATCGSMSVKIEESSYLMRSNVLQDQHATRQI